MKRRVALASWCFLVWLGLTWTVTLEQILFGLVVSIGVAVAIAPLGEVAAPWSLLAPRRLAAIGALTGRALVRIVFANVRLARRIWDPKLPLSSGMVIAPTETRTDGEVTAVALITSLIVDNQFVDLDRSRDELQYHAVIVPPGGPDDARAAINGPVEGWIRPFVAGADDA